MLRELPKLLLEPHHADALGRHGQAVVRERYTAEVMAERTLDYYQGVLNSRAISRQVSPSRS